MKVTPLQLSEILQTIFTLLTHITNDQYSKY